MGNKLTDAEREIRALAKQLKEARYADRQAKLLAGEIQRPKFNPFKKPHKYKAKPTEYDGIKYPSIAEATRAMLLDDLLKGNEIDCWLRQVPVRLGPDTIYRVDFLVHGVTNEWKRDRNLTKVWAEDVKGMETKAFKTIRKLWKKYGPFPLHIIKGKRVEVIEPDPKDD